MTMTDEHAVIAQRMGLSPSDERTPQPEAGETMPQYVERLRQYIVELSQSKVDKVLKRPAIKTFGCAKRSVDQPPFKPEFETLEQMNLRVNGTLIYVGDELFYVAGIHEAVKEGKTDFLLMVTDYRERSYHVWYSDSRVDLRAPEPQYILYQNRPAFMTRLARRQQQQGLSRGNTGVKFVGQDRYYNAESINDIMVSLKHRDPVYWDAKIADLMTRARAISALRLTEKVAVYTEKDKLLAEYKGRPFGEVHDDCIYCASDDARQPWIKKDAAAAGMSLKENTRV